MSALAARAKLAGRVLGIVGFPLLSHLGLTHTHSLPFVLAVMLAQLAFLGVTIARLPRIAKWLGVALLASWVLVFAAGYHPLGLIAAAAIPHTTAYLALLIVFARSLRPGRTPVITYFAEQIHGEIAADVVRYTRRVTWVWTCFFAMQLITSLALFILTPVEVWSYFVNVLNFPAIVMLLLGEKLLRTVFLAAAPRERLDQVVEMMGSLRFGPARSHAASGE